MHLQDVFEAAQLRELRAYHWHRERLEQDRIFHLYWCDYCREHSAQIAARIAELEKLLEEEK